MFICENSCGFARLVRYDLLRKHARVCEVEPWEAMARDEAPPDSLPASSLLNLSDIIEVNLLGKSELLDPFLASALAKELPLRLQYSDWICMYSSYEHGMSLSNMYRKLRDDVSEPCLMIIRDANRSVFGCYATGTCPLLGLVCCAVLG